MTSIPDPFAPRALGSIGLRGYANEMLDWRAQSLFGVHVAWSEHIDAASLAEAAAGAVGGVTAGVLDAATQALALVGRDAGPIVERYQLAAVRSSAKFLNGYGLDLGRDDVDRLAQGRVGANLTRSVPEIYAIGRTGGRMTVEGALRAAEVYLTRVAATDIYRIGGAVVADITSRGGRFTGRWRRRHGPGACLLCVEAAGAGWSTHYDLAVAPLHPMDSCVVEPERNQ